MSLHCDFCARSLLAAACLTLAAASPAPAATPCIVLGSASARVSSVEGIRSPVFETRSCAALRLVSGRALASWVDAGGQPKLVPITPSGVASFPRPGSEVRSVRVAWAELTSTRADEKPAYMRSMGLPHPVPVYIPSSGLRLPAPRGSALRVRIQPLGAPAAALQDIQVPAGKPVLLTRAMLPPGRSYRIELQAPGAQPKRLEWRVVDASEQALIDSRLQALARQLPDASQREIVTAMLYDQMKLETNLSLFAPRLRAAAHTQAPG